MDTREVIDWDAQVNWSAAVTAGLAAGGVVWLLSHGTPWFTSGMISAEMMGRDLGQVGLRASAATGVHFLLSICYALALTPLIMRWRKLWALVAGGAGGLVLYGLNFLVFSGLGVADWPRTELPAIVTHFVFGLIAAGIYKGLAARRRLAR